MTQLSETKTKTAPNASTTRPSGHSSATKTSEKSKLGYEVLYGRRTSAIQVPLSVSQENSAYPSTGSALLDSFVSQAIAEPVPLQHLRLVNVANQRIVNRRAQGTQPLRQPLTPTTARPTGEEAPSKERLKKEPPQEEALQEKCLIEGLSTGGDQTGGQTTTQRPDVSVDNRRAETAPPKPPSNPLLQPEQKVSPLSEASISTRTTPADTIPKESAQPTLEKTAEETTEDQSFSEQPPAAAEPDTIDLAAIESKAQRPPTKQPASKPAQQQASSNQPGLKKSTPAPPSFSPVPSAQPGAHPINAPLSDSKLARDSAAAVGLIDINDTLLFGGDHQNLASTDPFISNNHTQGEHTGVLSYLSQQVSAFTVDKLQSGFPHNTDPRVINRIDPPKHKTVLGLKHFKLSQLDEETPAPKQLAKTSNGYATAAAPEINALSQQVNDLNRKIAELSQKLAQVTQE